MGRTGCLIQNLTLIGSFFIYRYLICVFFAFLYRQVGNIPI